MNPKQLPIQKTSKLLLRFSLDSVKTLCLAHSHGFVIQHAAQDLSCQNWLLRQSLDVNDKVAEIIHD